MPRKIRQLLKDYRKAGFYLVKGGKGDHRKLKHDLLNGAVILDGKDGDDVKNYQEKDFSKALEKLNKP